MKVPLRTMSGPDFIVCPTCGRGELRTQSPYAAGRCDSCGRAVDKAMKETLW